LVAGLPSSRTRFQQIACLRAALKFGGALGRDGKVKSPRLPNPTAATPAA